MTDTAYALYVENGTTLLVRLFSESDYDKVDLFVRIDHIEDLQTPQRDVSLLDVTLSRTPFHMYGFDYFRVTVSVTFHSEVCVDEVITPPSGGMTISRQFMNNGTMILLLDGLHRLKAMRQLHMDRDIGRVQQHIPVLLISREDRVANSGGGRIKIGSIANKVAGIGLHDFTFLDVMKTILHYSVVFAKAYTGKLVAARIVDIAKDMIRSDFHTAMSAQSYYGYIQVAKVILGHENVVSLEESLNGVNTKSKILEISHLNDISFYTGATEELPTLIGAVSNFL